MRTGGGKVAPPSLLGDLDMTAGDFGGLPLTETGDVEINTQEERN